jgi:hypothetical protein
MRPAPRQKLPEISPIFKPDTARLHVSRAKDKEIVLGRCRMDDTKVVEPDGCGQLAGKLGPPSGPPVFSSLGAAHVHQTVHFFALVFEVALRVTAPFRYA